MSILIEGNDIQGATTGIRVPNSGDITIKINKFRDVGTAIDVYDPAFARLLGLPNTVPQNEISELVSKLKKNPDASDEEIAKVVASSKLSKWLGNSDLLLKVTSGFIALVRTGFELFK